MFGLPEGKSVLAVLVRRWSYARSSLRELAAASDIKLVEKIKTTRTKACNSGDGACAEIWSGHQFIDLPPVITNLANPPNAWVRLQASIVYDKEGGAEAATARGQSRGRRFGRYEDGHLAQISGASGLEHLREDLNERASIRSDSHIRELIIQSVVVQ